MADSLKRLTSRRFSIWQKAVALAPVLLLLLYLPGETMLRCRIDGMLRASCCCPHKAATESSGPVVKAADCCDQEATQSTRLTVVATIPANHDLVQVATAAIVAAPLPSLASPIERLDRAWQRHGPAREGPPLVLLKHAFLI
jgi:hypothetical protein